MKVLQLKLLGVDSCSRKVYKDINTKRLYKDTDCINNQMTVNSICTTGSFDGEPDVPLCYINNGDFKIEVVE